MKKIDFKNDPWNKAAKKPALVHVPELSFLTIDGKGDPNTSAEFQEAVKALYAVSYAIRMSPKKGVAPEGYQEYTVGTLEGLWWAEGSVPKNMSEVDLANKNGWLWTLMIRQPDFVTPAVFESFRDRTLQAGAAPACERLRFERFLEGECVQVLHVGPYADELPTVLAMEEFARLHGKHMSGKHHEIYLSSPDRTDPAKLKTVLRHPVS